MYKARAQEIQYRCVYTYTYIHTYIYKTYIYTHTKPVRSAPTEARGLQRHRPSKPSPRAVDLSLGHLWRMLALWVRFAVAVCLFVFQTSGPTHPNLKSYVEQLNTYAATLSKPSVYRFGSRNAMTFHGHPFASLSGAEASSTFSTMKDRKLQFSHVCVRQSYAGSKWTRTRAGSAVPSIDVARWLWPLHLEKLSKEMDCLRLPA